MNATEERVWFLIAGAFGMILFVFLLDLLQESFGVLVGLGLLVSAIASVYLLYQILTVLLDIRTELQTLQTTLQADQPTDWAAQSSRSSREE